MGNKDHQDHGEYPEHHNPRELADKIKNQGYVYRGHPGNITKHLERVEDKLGIPRFPLHKLRHYFASQMSALGIPEADILKMGGWETDHVMKSVYRHSMMEKEEKAKREAAEKLRKTLFLRQFHDKFHDKKCYKHYFYLKIISFK